MMKKLTALLIFLLLFCTFAFATTIDYTGVWYLVSVETEGTVLNPADLGMEMSFTLNEDGTAFISQTEEEDLTATWTADGTTITIAAEDEPVTFILTDDGLLVGGDEDLQMTFGREAPSPGFVPSPEKAATDIIEFDGTWNITMVNAFGMVVPFSAMADMVGFGGTIIIQNGNIAAFGELEAEIGVLTDGKLIVASPIEDGELGKNISLLEDGSLSLEYMGMIFYCEKAETME